MCMYVCVCGFCFVCVLCVYTCCRGIEIYVVLYRGWVWYKCRAFWIRVCIGVVVVLVCARW